MALSYITIAIVCFKQFLRKIVLSAIMSLETLMQYLCSRLLLKCPCPKKQIESKYNVEVQVKKEANSICFKLPNALLTV